MLEIKGGKYAKTLAKIQVRAIFHMRDIRSVHLILEELMNIKVILFLTHELFR